MSQKSGSAVVARVSDDPELRIALQLQIVALLLQTQVCLQHYYHGMDLDADHPPPTPLVLDPGPCRNFGTGHVDSGCIAPAVDNLGTLPLGNAAVGR